MIFIHGWCSNLGHWEPQARRFRGRHRVLRIDRRGFGRSSVPRDALTPKQHAADIAAVARSERIRSAVVVGHAGGGWATLELARGFPSLVKAVVLVETFPMPPARLPAQEGDELAQAVEAMVTALEGPGGQEQIEPMYQTFFGQHADRRMVQAAARSASRVPAHIAASEARKYFGAGSAAAARRIRRPVLVISAESARAFLTPAAVREYIPHAAFAQTVGSEHFPQLEVPDQVNAMLETFMEQL